MSLPFVDFQSLLRSLSGAPAPTSSLYMWGDNTSGQLGDNKTINYYSWSQISAGGGHTVALRNDGTLWAWGKNDRGQVGDGTTVNKNSPVSISATSSRWIGISAGDAHSVAVADNNLMFAWGDNRYGQLGIGLTTARSAPVQIGTSSWIQVAAGQFHSAALNINNNIFGWGDNIYGQLGNSSLDSKSSPVQISTSANDDINAMSFYLDGNSYISVNADDSHTLGTSLYTIEYWIYPTLLNNTLQDIVNKNGSGTLGYTFRITNNILSYGVEGMGISGLSPLTANTWYHVAVSFDGARTRYYLNGTLQGSSSAVLGVINDTGPLYIGARQLDQSMKFTGYVSNLRILKGTALYTGSSITPPTSPLSVIENTTLLTCQYAYLDASVSNNRVNNGSTVLSNLNPFYTANTPESYVSLAAGANTTLAITTTGLLYAWGKNTYGQLGYGTKDIYPLPVKANTKSWIAISSGSNHSVGIDNTNKLYTWGLNYDGQLGVSNSSATYFKTVVNGGDHFLALRNDNTLWTWGLNTYGQLGDGTTLNRSSPVQVGTSAWSTISGGTSYSAGITTTGKLYVWGSNSQYQFGDNSTIARSSPVQVGTSSWSQVAAGDGHVIGIQTDNSLWGWGLNNTGQVGGAFNTIGTSWAKVVSGLSHTIGLKLDGTLWTWGANTSGQLGDGTVATKSSPVAVGVGSVYVDIAAGANHSLAVRSDGALFGWGLNTTAQAGSFSWKQIAAGLAHSLFLRSDGGLFAAGSAAGGALGDGTTVTKSSPVAVGNSWAQVAAGISISAGIKLDGRLFTWGLGTTGQTGNNDSISRSSPIQIGTSSWSQVSAYDNIMAVTSDGYLFSWGNNQNGQIGVGDNLTRISPVQVGSALPLGGYSGTFVNPAAPTTATTGYTLSGTTLPTFTGNFTISVWVYLTQATNSFVFANYPNTGSALGMYITGSGNIYVYMGPGGFSTQLLTSVDLVSLNVWTYVTVTRTGSTVSLHINGVFQVSATYSGTVNSATDTMSFGYYDTVTTPSYGFSGYINSLRFYNGSAITSVPTTPQASDANTKLYLFAGSQPNLDYGVSNFTLVTFGTPNSTATNPYAITQVGGLSSVAIGSAGLGYYAITTNNSLYSWGSNQFGQLGLNDTISRSNPVQISGSWSTVFAGTSSVIATKTDSTLWSWGGNNFGQLGLGDQVSRSTPTQITAPSSSWNSVHVGKNHVIAINTSNTVFGWGSNQYIHLGLTNPASYIQVTSNYAITDKNIAFAYGTNSQGQTGIFTNYVSTSSASLAPTTDTLWKSFAAGPFSLAIKKEGTLWAWGANSVGQLGVGDTIGRSSPVQIGTDSDWSSISIWVDVVNGQTSAAIKSDGRLFVWGGNSNGQLGFNDLVSRSYPTQIAGSWTQVSVGANNIAAITTDSTLFVWGFNGNGQIGDGTVISRSSPVQIAGSWTQVAVGVSSTALLNTINQIYTTGYNTNGQLGLGIVTAKSSPTQVPGTTSWISVTAGMGNFFAITSAQTLFSWGLNTSGVLGVGDVLPRSNPTQIAGSWVQVGPGYSDMFAIDSTYSKIYAWGDNTAGKLAIGNSIPRSAPTQITSLPTNNIVYTSPTALTALSSNTSFALGDAYTIATNGTTNYTYGIGFNTTGQLGDSSTISRSTPTQILSGTQTPNRSSPVQIGTSSWTKVGAGSSHSIAIKADGTLYTWGDNTYGQLGDSTVTTAQVPENNISGSFTSVAASSDFTLALKSDYKIWTWGRNNTGQLGLGDTVNRSSPSQVSTGSYTLISAGALTAYAIDNSNKLYGWGDNTYGQLGSNFIGVAGVSTPSVLDATNSYASIASGSSHVVTQRLNNTIWVWGDNTYGQLGQNDAIARSNPVQIAGSYSLVGSTRYNTFIQAPGMLMGLGFNTTGQVGDRTILSRSSPVMIPASQATSFTTPVRLGPTSWSQVAAGYSHSVAVKPDYTVWGWGVNGSGQLGQNATTWRSSPVQIPALSALQISASKDITAVLTTDKTLYVMGSNTFGQLGLNDISLRSTPTQVGASSYWNEVTVGPSHTVAIRENDAVYAWGANVLGALGQGDTITRSSPVQLGASKYSMVTASSNNTVLVNPYGDLYTLGDSRYGQLGNNQLIYHSWIQLSTGDSALAIRDDKTLWAWGLNNWGQLGDGTTVNKLYPVQVAGSWNFVNAAISFTMGIKSDGSLWTWGINTNGQLMLGDVVARSNPTQVASSGSWVMVSGKTTNSYAIKSDGSLWSAGNGVAVLGNGVINAGRSTPLQIGTDNSWVMVAAHTTGAFAISSTNKLFAWGTNSTGTLGLGTADIRSIPTQVGTSNWSYITSNNGISGVNSTSLAIDTNGRLFMWGTSSTVDGRFGFLYSPTSLVAGGMIRSDGVMMNWGLNDNGQVGDGTTANKPSPTTVASVSTVYFSSFTQVSSGYVNKYAITSDGVLWGWGDNSVGQIGNASTVTRTSPLLVGGSWLQVASGNLSAYAIKSDYTLWSWGNNSVGQLGQNTDALQLRSSPSQVTSGSWTKLAAGNQFAFAIKNDGTLWGWGDNRNGQLGLTTPSTFSWVSLSSGNHVLAIRSDNKLFAWGENSLGQLGDGTTVNKSSPVFLASGSYTQVATGLSSSYAIKSDGSLWAWGSNSNGQLGTYDLTTTSRSTPVQIFSTSPSAYSVTFNGSTDYLSTPASSVNTFGTNDFAIEAWIYPTAYGATTGSGVIVSHQGGGMFQLYITTTGALSLNMNVNAGTTSATSNITGTTVAKLNEWTHVAGVRYNNTLKLYVNGVAEASTLNMTGITVGSFGGPKPIYVGVAGDATLPFTGLISNARIVNGNGVYTGNFTPMKTLANTQSSGTNINAITSGQTTVLVANSSTFIDLSNNNFTVTPHGSNSIISTNNSETSYYDWSSISSGMLGHALSIKTDGRLFGWGNNLNKQLGLSTNSFSYPVQITTGSWTNASAGYQFSLGTKSDSTLWAWGDNTYGQLGVSDFNLRSSPVQVGTSSWSQVSAGRTHGAAISVDGKLFTWGSNSSGQVGTPVSITSIVPSYDFVAIRTNDNNFFGMGNGTAYEFGYNSPLVLRSYPTQIANPDPGYYWTQVATQRQFATIMLRNDGKLFSIGIGGQGFGAPGSTGLGDQITRSSPTQIGTDSWKSVVSSGNASYAIRYDDTLWSWGNNGSGELGTGDTIARSSPTQVPGSWKSVSGQSSSIIAQKLDGTLWSWGYNNIAQLGLGDSVNRSSPVQVGTDNTWVYFEGATQGNNFIGIKADGTLWLTGAGFFFGESSSVNYRSVPTQLGTGTNWVQATGGWGTIHALKSDGSLWAWGYTTTGQTDLGLNDGSTSVVRSSPTQIGTSSWSFVKSSAGATYALRIDGTLFVWGGQGSQSGVGVLGTGDTIARSSPTQVGTWTWSNKSSPTQVGTSSWSSVAAGSDFTIARNVDNTIWGWGNNLVGRVGLGTGPDRSSPTQIGSASNWSYIEAGVSNGAAIDSSGNLYTWGQNALGQLGTNDATVYRVPTLVGTTSSTIEFSPKQIGTSSWSMISTNATAQHTIGMTTDGIIYAWGLNSSGQLGVGDLITRSSPVQVSTPYSNVLQIAAGGSNSAIIPSNNTMFIWGSGTYGQIGNSSTVDRSFPVQVGAIPDGYYSGKFPASTDNLKIAASADWALGTTSTIEGWIYLNAYDASNNLRVCSQSNTRTSIDISVAPNGKMQLHATSVTTVDILPLQAWVHLAVVYNNGTVSVYWNGVSKALTGTPTGLDITNSTSQLVIGGYGASSIYSWNGYISNLRIVKGTAVYSSTFVPSTTPLISIAGTVLLTLQSSTIKDNGPSGYTITTGGLVQMVSNFIPFTATTSGAWTNMALGTNFVHAINPSGVLSSWGINSNAELGDGTTVDKSTPTIVSSYAVPSAISSPVQIGTSSWSIVGIGLGNVTGKTSDGLLFSWGNGVGGSLGLGDLLSRSQPVQINTSPYALLSVGTSFALASDGNLPQTLFGWGYNPTGQLGDGTAASKSVLTVVATYNLNENKSSPVQITSMNYSPLYRTSPTQIGTSSWTQVSAGYSHTVAATSDNIVFSWGNNQNGNLGNSTTINRSSPVQVGAGAYVEAGNNYTMTISTDGTAFGIGDNTYGQLGDAT